MVIGIIEDDELLKKALDTTLKRQGYITVLAGSKKEAIQNINRYVDLLIVDIGLPDGDGISLYQELQRNQNPTYAEDFLLFCLPGPIYSKC